MKILQFNRGSAARVAAASGVPMEEINIGGHWNGDDQCENSYLWHAMPMRLIRFLASFDTAGGCFYVPENALDPPMDLIIELWIHAGISNFQWAVDVLHKKRAEWKDFDVPFFRQIEIYMYMGKVLLQATAAYPDAFLGNFPCFQGEPWTGEKFAEFKTNLSVQMLSSTTQAFQQTSAAIGRHQDSETRASVQLNQYDTPNSIMFVI